VFALATGVALLTLRPFAAFASSFIRSSLDSEKFPTLVKCGRYLEVPQVYSQLAFERFKGHVNGNKADIILAQQLGAWMWTRITSVHVRTYSNQVNNPMQLHGNEREFDVIQLEQRRLGDIRGFDVKDFKDYRKSFTFQDLIDKGYLVPKATEGPVDVRSYIP